MSTVDSSLSIDARRHFLQALRRVLRPLVRLMVRRGIRYDQFAEIARTAYVESAVRDGIGDVGQPTLEQIAWATGIEEERINHYFDLDNIFLAPPPVSKSTQVMTQVLQKWHTEARYVGTNGAPLELQLTEPSSGPNFCGLVRAVNEHADPRIILDGLLEAKSVTVSGDDRVRPLTRVFIWPQGSITSVDYFGVTLARMTETLEHNLNSTSSESKRLERSVFADHGLSPDLLTAFHAFATECANKFLSELDDWLAGHYPTSFEQTEGCQDIGVNLFFYVEQPVNQESLSSLVQPEHHTSN